MTDVKDLIALAKARPSELNGDSKITTLVLGGRHAALGRKDIGRYSVETLLDLTGRSLGMVTGIRAKECEDLRRTCNAQHASGS